ncbi:hypothetical protein Y032_0237g3242 [Ancylostoma ceylanicum]|nr:hypothetical protein Y032_0237g3242 [Ancylostoma ceylanicum]
MLLLALWDCRRLVQLWLHMSCLLILFAVSGGFFYDLLKSLRMDEDKIVYEWLPGLVTAYGGFGCIVSVLTERIFCHICDILVSKENYSKVASRSNLAWLELTPTFLRTAPL